MILQVVFRHRVDATEHTARDEKPADEAEHDHDRSRPFARRGDDVIKPLALVEIATDQQTETAGKSRSPHTNA